MQTITVVGGNVNSKLTTWLGKLGIKEYNHMSTRITKISPSDIQESGVYLQFMIPTDAIIISVGPLADRLLNSVFILHGALPSTTSTDNRKLETALIQCRNYLQLRGFYAINHQPPGPRIS